jgi:hypothetical protein
MLADDVIAAQGGLCDQTFTGAVTALAADIRLAARYDLSQGVMLSAQTLHQQSQATRLRALPLCRLPFQHTWFEWPGFDPSGGGYRLVGPAREAPVPRRVGALVSVDDSRQRGTMSWAWFTREQNQGVNVCPLAVTFDWRAEFEPIEDLSANALARFGIDKAVADHESWEALRRQRPGRLAGVTEAQLQMDRDRFGIVWSPYAAEYAAGYTRENGPLDPSHKLWQYCIGDITGEPGMLQCVILLLNARNLTLAEPVAAPERLNKQRARKGRPPLLDYTTIRIKLSHALTQRAGASGERSAARMHVVAGHFKVRKTGVYWWSDHARGDPTQGVVRQQTRMVDA